MKEGALKQRDDLREESGNHERFNTFKQKLKIKHNFQLIGASVR